MENISKYDKRRAFNEAVGPGKKYKINKRRFIPDSRVFNSIFRTKLKIFCDL